MGNSKNKFVGNRISKTSKKYIPSFIFYNRKNNVTLPLNTSTLYTRDPKALAFISSRHKFIGKMIEGKKKVLDIGCGDGFGTTIVSQFVNKIIGIDYYKIHIDEAKRNLEKNFTNIKFLAKNIFEVDYKNYFDAAYSMDVLEHISKKEESNFMKSACKTLKSDGIFIVGMPSVESQKYASAVNKKEHINCKTGKSLKQFCEKFFKSVFLFSMNDEIVHTGFTPMSQYIICICVFKK
jgi:2-polyprenyl-3-methyl-5-hydroxy-6-metoxy-1,4-benzoquinol methylase